MDFKEKRKKLLYGVIVLCFITAAIWIYGLWWRYYEVTHPRIAQAIPHSYEEQVPLYGVLLWDEVVVTSPLKGTLSYAVSGHGGRVSKGDVIATVTASARQQLRAPQTGYFIPGLDGVEGGLSYSSLWGGEEKFPDLPSLRYFPGNHKVNKGDAIGKIIPMPQQLRIVGYADLTPALEKQLARGVLLVRRGPKESLYEAGIRVVRKMGYRTKLYLSLPFFPVNIVKNRSVSYLISTEERVGVSVPQSAVILRGGKLGVFLVEGNYACFKEINGIPLSDHLFFVTSGLQPGNIVILKADHAREGRVELW
ncbi:MAG: hypothetical protein WCQ97_00265 [Aminobacterium sp.]|jgi:hypothetical protein|uniref:hypothetical protein n=1 Tax=unclassified Aminobacterium TaxID=2685012 RepID=UPI001BCD776D|nr:MULTISPECIES: hypothetical protein [unclassified Aminobacterium]MDD2206161.1 hypothetical protein [Aminobacterium sp.]MDD3425456.1 hypothetical protein [Aminobacterium sp.]MDD3707060.1 hypothetical protein [Aminobacterium sp.]MDD4227995.1 hypothetical protein [Aminobacterium sp.]MDD4551158.1 hypothetical protein [Aminobacterium sp.]